MKNPETCFPNCQNKAPLHSQSHKTWYLPPQPSLARRHNKNKMGRNRKAECVGVVLLTWHRVKWAPLCWGRWCIPRSWGSLCRRRSGLCRRTDTRRWSRSLRTRRSDRWPGLPPPGSAVQRSERRENRKNRYTIQYRAMSWMANNSVMKCSWAHVEPSFRWCPFHTKSSHHHLLQMNPSTCGMFRCFFEHSTSLSLPLCQLVKNVSLPSNCTFYPVPAPLESGFGVCVWWEDERWQDTTITHVTQTYCVNHVVHQLVDFGPLEPRLPTVPHDFGVGSCDII